MSTALNVLISKISSMIQQQETGGGTAGVGSSLNNPGALKFAGWETAYGATPSSSGFAQFPSLDQGSAAADDLVSQYVSQGKTIQQIIAAWAPPSDGNTNDVQRVSEIAQATSLGPASSVMSQAGAGAGSGAAASGSSGSSSGPLGALWAALAGAGLSVATMGQYGGSGSTGKPAAVSARLAVGAVGFVLLIIGIAAVALVHGVTVINQTTSKVKGLQKAAGKVADLAAL